jgi:hypothetical protein
MEYQRVIEEGERLDAEVARLDSAADELEAEAAAAAQLFERDPSEKAFAAKAVKEQQAKNAREHAIAFAASERVRSARAAATEARRRLDLAELLPQVQNWQDLFADDTAELTKLIDDFNAALMTRLESLSEKIGAHNSKVAKALRLGAGAEEPKPITLQMPRVLKVVTDEVGKTWGKTSPHDHPPRFSRVEVRSPMSHNVAFVMFELAAPCPPAWKG